MMRNVSVAGQRFCVDDDKPSFWDRAEAGLWEPDLLAELGRVLRPGSLFLDLGAWVGPTSLFAAACGATVIALEPDAAAARQFRRNMAANAAFSDHVRLIEAALAAAGGKVRLASPRKPGDSMGSLLLAGRGGVDWQAAALTADALMAELPPTRPLVVKIDIEGGEYGLGAHFGAIMARQPALVLLAFHPALMLSADKASETRLQTATEAVFAAFSGMEAQILGVEGGDPRVEALHRPITVRFSRG